MEKKGTGGLEGDSKGINRGGWVKLDKMDFSGDSEGGVGGGMGVALTAAIKGLLMPFNFHDMTVGRGGTPCARCREADSL